MILQYRQYRLRFMRNAWLHVRVINFRIIIIINEAQLVYLPLHATPAWSPASADQ